MQSTADSAALRIRMPRRYQALSIGIEGDQSHISSSFLDKALSWAVRVPHEYALSCISEVLEFGVQLKKRVQAKRTVLW